MADQELDIDPETGGLVHDETTPPFGGGAFIECRACWRAMPRERWPGHYRTKAHREGLRRRLVDETVWRNRHNLRNVPSISSAAAEEMIAAIEQHHGMPWSTFTLSVDDEQRVVIELHGKRSE